MKTYLTIEIKHENPLKASALTDDVANRVYTMLHAAGNNVDVTVQQSHPAEKFQDILILKWNRG